MKVYPVYKESGYDWTGNVPDHWDMVQLKFVAPRITEKTENPNEYDLQVVLENIERYTGKLIDKGSFDGMGNIFKKGDVLFNKLRPYLCKAIIAPSSGVAVGELLVLRPREDIDSRYLHYRVLESMFMSIIDGSTYGAKMPRTNWDFIGNLKVPVPPLPEQQTIADFLDCKTAQIDTLIAKKQYQIGLLQEQRMALINHSVTKGLDQTASMKDSDIEWLGEIPKHWNLAKAKRISTIFVPQRNKPELNQDGCGLPWVTTEDLLSEKISKSCKGYYVSNDAAISSGSKSLPAGSVIASCVGKFGISSVAGNELIVNQQLQAYIPHNINPLFLHYYITVSKHYYERVATASTLPYVNRENFGLLPVPIPPDDEQNRIILHIKNNNKLLDDTIDNYQNQIGFFQEYRASLISAAVTGKIDVLKEN